MVFLLLWVLSNGGLKIPKGVAKSKIIHKNQAKYQNHCKCILDTPCTAGARSAIDWSERVKNEECIGRRCTRIDTKEFPNCTFILIMTPRTSIRWFFKDFKKLQKTGPKRGPRTCLYPRLMS